MAKSTSMRWLTAVKCVAAAVAIAGLCGGAFVSRAVAYHGHFTFLQSSYIKPFAPEPRQVPDWMFLHDRLVERAKLLTDQVAVHSAWGPRVVRTQVAHYSILL